MSARGTLRVLLLALIWGSAFLWIKLALGGFTPVQLTWARLALGASVLLIVLSAQGVRLPTSRALWRHLIVAALLGNAIPYTLFGLAEQHIDSSLAGAINASAPLWTLAIAAVAGTDRSWSLRRGVGLAAGYAGTLLVLAPWQHTDATVLVGALECLAASISYGASYVYIGRNITPTGLPPTVLSAAQLLAATGWLTLSLPFAGLTAPTWGPAPTIALLILGILGTGAAYILNYRIITDDGPVLASTVSYLLPLVALGLGALAQHEHISALTLAGVAIVLTGVTLTRHQSLPRPRESDDA